MVERNMSEKSLKGECFPSEFLVRHNFKLAITNDI